MKKPKGGDGANTPKKPRNTISRNNWNKLQDGADKTHGKLPFMDQYTRGLHVQKMAKKAREN